jgi:gliding motility-associated-like protein
MIHAISRHFQHLIVLVFIHLIPYFSLAQTTVKRLNACIDDIKSITKADFPCASSNSTLTPANVLAIKKQTDGGLQIQFAQTGEVTVTCNCPNGATEIVRIDVTDCDSIKCKGTNLVPNPSFENFTCSGSALRNTSLTGIVPPWFDFTGVSVTQGSSDYYNPNCPYTTINSFGQQFLNVNKPRTGAAFIGQYAFIFPAFQREYTSVSLAQPLTIGKKYRARFYSKVTPPTTTTYMKVDRIGMSLTTQNPRNTIKTTATTFGNTNDYIGNTPVAQSSPFGVPTGDTTFWTRYEGIFTADSAYTFLTLGALAKFADIKTFGNSAAAYYFFDDISIHQIDLPPDTTRLRDSLTCTAKDTGFIQKRLTNRFGCDSLVLQRIVLINPIKVDIGRDTTLLTGSLFTIQTRITGDSLASIMWTPPTGLSCTNCRSPQIVANAKVQYITTVVGQKGCRASDTLLIGVKEQDYIFVPNAFSPNKDGINDVLTVYGAPNRVKSILRFAIFNRWGDLVFDRRNFAPNDESAGWSGNDLEPEVYVYFVEAELQDGQKIIASGGTTLVR